jgi:hypothetical protein
VRAALEEIDHLRPENERLREALQNLYDYAERHPGKYAKESDAAFRRAEFLLSGEVGDE